MIIETHPLHRNFLSHPVRLRILGLIGRHVTTASRVAERMTDVPRPTVFRHVKQLIDAGVVRVVRENAVRGATEGGVELAEDLKDVAPSELTQEESERLVSRAVGGMLASYRHTLAHYKDATPPPHLATERLHLTQSELQEIQRQFTAYMSKWLDRNPSPGSHPYAIALTLLPEVEGDDLDLPISGLG